MFHSFNPPSPTYLCTCKGWRVFPYSLPWLNHSFGHLHTYSSLWALLHSARFWQLFIYIGYLGSQLLTPCPLLPPSLRYTYARRDRELCLGAAEEEAEVLKMEQSLRSQHCSLLFPNPGLILGPAWWRG